jgi:agmatinase
MGAAISIQGILYDEKSSFMRGPALAPPKIRSIWNNGSSNFFSESGIDISKSGIKDLGDFSINTYFDIEQITHQNLRISKYLLSLGGDHSVTYPIVKAYHTVFPVFDILHFDAHADLYDVFENDRHSHACPFARIMENQLTSRLVQVGVRTLSAHQRDQARKFNVEIYEMKNHSKISFEFQNPVYISLDMDAIDPAFAPGVSHHEPGGLTPRQIIRIIQKLNVPVVGADIVEYNPVRDIHDMTGALVTKLMKEILAKMVDHA